MVRPGGRIGVTGWTPDGVPGQFLRLIGAFAPPPPPAAGDPLAWGDAGYVLELFAAAAPQAEVTATRERVDVTLASADDAVTLYTTQFGPLVLARPSLEASGNWEPMVAAMHAFFAAMPPAPGGGILMHSDYLQTVVHLPR